MTPVARILLAYVACTLEEKQRGLTEYPRYRVTVAEIAAESGVPHDVSAAVLAVLSPALTWRENQESARCVFNFRPTISGYGQNVRKARHIYEAWINRALPLHVSPAAPWKPDYFVTGPKVTAFFRLIRDGGNDTDVCVDGHAFNLAMGRGRIPLKKTKGSRREFDIVREAYRLAGRVVGVQPCAIQAATWLAWRSSDGFAQGRIHFPARREQEQHNECRRTDPYRYTS